MGFSDLSTERQIGMGIGPIPRSKVREYARDVLELTDDSFDRFCEVMARVDDDYTSMQNDPKDKSKQRSVVNIDDAAGVKSLFERLEQPRKKHGHKQLPQ